MTFDEYWSEKGHFGSSPEDVAKLAWFAATERAAKIAENGASDLGGYEDAFVTSEHIAARIRSGE